MKDEIKTLLGETFTLTTGEMVTVKPVGFGKLPQFSTAVAQLFRRLKDQGIEKDAIEDWQKLFDVAFEETISIMMMVLDKPREWFDEIEIADGVDLLDKIITQNLNDRVKKKIRGLWQKAKEARSSSLSSMLSKSLPKADTAEKTSSDIALTKSEDFSKAL